MLTQVDKKTLFQDRYQALIMPVPVSGIFRHRALLKYQSLYPEHYTVYKQACERSQLLLGDVLVMCYSLPRSVIWRVWQSVGRCQSHSSSWIWQSQNLPKIRRMLSIWCQRYKS